MNERLLGAGRAFDKQDVQPAFEDRDGEPGVTLDDRLLVGTGEGAVRLLRVQREGRGPQDAEAFLRGTPVPPGTRLL